MGSIGINPASNERIAFVTLAAPSGNNYAELLSNGYVMVYDNNHTPLLNTSVTIYVYYFEI